MKIWILLLIAGVLLFCGMRMREGFEATATIKAPPYNAEEKTRMFEMLSKADQDILVNEVKVQGGDGGEERNILNAKAFLENVVGRFYSFKYMPATQPITIEIVKAYVAEEVAKRGMTGAVIMPNTAGAYESALKAYFIDQQTLATTASGTTAGGTTGGSSTTSAAPNAGPVGSSGKGKEIYGPIFTSLGSPDNGGKDTSKNNKYPQLLGGMGDCSSVRTPSGIQGPSQSWLLSQSGSLPSTASLGCDANSGLLPYSRVPGDQDLIPDPYRLSRNYTTSSYSNKTDPVPFLTDFSAFQK